MKFNKKSLIAIIPSFLAIGVLGGFTIHKLASRPNIGKDTAIYDDLTHASISDPDIVNGRYVRDANDEEEEEGAVVVNKVILHYYNEAGGNDGRAFYLWVTGQDGAEYNLENASDIMSVNADRTMMTITIDFTDARFTAFAGKSKLFFIIKYKMISAMNLNWGGQSDDMQLVYSEFPPQEGSDVCEVWTMPAAGGGIVILDSENKTRVHGVSLAQFVDWKTIRCKVTADTSTVDWKLYAYDETYFRIKPKKREVYQKRYLVADGSASPNYAGEFDITFTYDAHINLVYSLVSHDPSTDDDPDMAELNKTVTVRFDKLYDDARFNTYYEQANLNATDLGMTYQGNSVTFKVWSPVSANMTVLLYDTDTPAEFGGDDKYKGYHMNYTSGGIWELTIDGDADNPLKGKYYNYQIDNTLGTNVVMDPYATTAGRCGVRGLIYDKSETNPEGWDELPVKWDGQTAKGLDITSPQELSIYEVHIQDFTGDSSWVSNQGNKNGTYNAFVESGTTLAEHNDVSTGYDHIKDLGIEAVQLLPVFDHDNDESAETLKYNWGYNPLNYNVVEGGYSSDPSDGLARVREFKNLVLQLSKTRANHANDVHTRVIMDVVYNHVSSATGSNFHKLMPRYYFRYAAKDYYNAQGEKYQSEGELWDGSGCHNEVATERPMMRKFIVDSLCMWANEYKIKGFRFDLMGLIDFKTMQAVQKALYEIDPDIYIYGEGWTSGGYHGEGSEQWKEVHSGEDAGNYGAQSWQIYNECNAGKVTNAVYLGGFNDNIRNAIRGENNVNGYPGKGYLQTGNTNDYGWRIAAGLWGVNPNVTSYNQGGWDELTGFYPEQTVNYVSCHDNWTVRDQLYNTLIDGSPASGQKLAHAVLQAHGLIFSSNSAAFMLGGEELLRTKELQVSDLSAVTADSYQNLHGHYISHNSYNAPLAVNTFKWGNKVEVKYDDQVINTGTGEGGYQLTNCFSSLIRAHKTLAKKRGTIGENYDQFVGSTSSGKIVNNIVWGSGSWGAFDSTSMGIQVNETFIYLCAGDQSKEAWADSRAKTDGSWEKVWDYGGYHVDPFEDGYKIYFHNLNTIVIFNSKGNCQEVMTMKKKLLVLPLILLTASMLGCKTQTYNPGVPYPGIPDYPSPGGGGGGGDEPLPSEFNMVVNFYLNYSNSITPIYTMDWYSLIPLETLPQGAALTDADAPDPYYPHFIGYSQYPTAIDESKLWNFAEDTYSSNELNLYGIWVRQ